MEVPVVQDLAAAAIRKRVLSGGVELDVQHPPQVGECLCDRADDVGSALDKASAILGEVR